MLTQEQLPFEVRASTSEHRSGGGHDMPDIALYDGGGDYVVVCGEVKLPSVDIREIALSEGQNDQVGRYLAQTRVVIVSNVRGFGLVTLRPGAIRSARIPPADRDIEMIVELWPSTAAMSRGDSISPDSIAELLVLLETAVTRHAPIAEPESLAKILASQAKRAKAQLPVHFTQAVKGLAEDFGKGLGVTFEGEEGEEFFRSSLIQTIFYGLFAGWTLSLRSELKEPFRWENLSEHLTIPFLAEIFHEFQHPTRIRELGLRSYLDIATQTLHRVDTKAFFKRFKAPSLSYDSGLDDGRDATAAILYFYEPFLEAFDPELRKQLGVWYTPREVVHYQVKTVERLLKNELGCKRGFADEKVVVLDPCCGTGAYLIEVMRAIAAELKAEGAEALIGSALLDAMQRRIVGFEILTAPFVIAHLQIFLILEGYNAKPSAAQRPAVFLTNALTGWDGKEHIKMTFPELQAEYEAAQAVKRGGKIIVILGNPPYNRFAGVPLEEEADLVDRYKGIHRNEKGKQIGPSDLFLIWGIRKQLLNDLYIRFVRLAERCIGERSEYGVVSFISNYGFYTGRSHPIMRESLMRSFDEIWIDCLNGDKYKTGKIIPRGLPAAGTTDQSIFSTVQNSDGIQLGTGITTLLKRNGGDSANRVAQVNYRNFWGKSKQKRESLIASLEMDSWTSRKIKKAERLPEGPRLFEVFEPTKETRWKLIPFNAVGGFEDWPALDQLFFASIQGINTNRGNEGSVVEISEEVLATRMKDYFSDSSTEQLSLKYPGLFANRARYNSTEVRKKLKAHVQFSDKKLVKYVIFPLDQRWLYYEPQFKLLNEARPELAANLENNEFLITVPEPRKQSESLPLLLSTAFDLHLHDRGSVCFPAEVRQDMPDSEGLFEYRANLVQCVWNSIKKEWGLEGDLFEAEALSFVREFCRMCLAICHAPNYQSEHKESLAQDWAHIPIPKSKPLFDSLAVCGDLLTSLLDPVKDATSALLNLLDSEEIFIAIPTKTGGGQVGQEDLLIEYSFFGAAKGGWRSRPFSDNEPQHEEWGAEAGDLYINNSVFFANVPSSVWKYELGGYPVLKKWLGNRDQGRRPGVALNIQELTHFRSMIHRIAAVLRLHSRLNLLYEEACTDCFTAEELGL